MSTTGIPLMFDTSASSASAKFVDLATVNCTFDDNELSPFCWTSDFNELSTSCSSVEIIELAAVAGVVTFVTFDEPSSLKF